MGSNKAPVRGPFASIHNPNPGLHYGAMGPSSARELGKARDPGIDQGIDMALVGLTNTSLHAPIGVGEPINHVPSSSRRQAGSHRATSQSLVPSPQTAPLRPLPGRLFLVHPPLLRYFCFSTGCRNSTTSIDSGRGSSSTGRRSVLPGTETDIVREADIQQVQ